MLRSRLGRVVDAVRDGRLADVADGARCTINGRVAGPTDLADLAGPIGTQPAVIDVAAGTACVFATVAGRQTDRPLVVGLRIGLEGDRLRELEILRSAEGESSIFAPERLIAGRNPVMEEPLEEPGDRVRIVAAADRYFSDLAEDTAHTVFQERCQRIENGFQTTGNPDVLGGSTCRQQIEQGWFGYITAVRGRRYPVVDVSTGVVTAVAFLDVPGALTHLALRDGTRLELSRRMRFPRSTLLFEQFKVDGDELAWIEAVMGNVDLGAPHGWEHTVSDVHPD